MLVVRTAEDPADSVGELISAKQSLGLCNLAFGVDPLDAGRRHLWSATRFPALGAPALKAYERSLEVS
jgi:hypothetical protein